MPNFLLLETSTDICSVAWSNGHEVLAQRETRVFHEHGRKLTRFIEAISSQLAMPLSKLDAIGVSQGPGSFTSLRIGIATAKGLAYALDKPLLALDAFEGMASQASRSLGIKAAYYIPLIDARSMGVFVAVYAADGQVLLPVERRKLDRTFLEQWQTDNHRVVFCGNAAEKYRTDFGEQGISYATHILPQAKALQLQALKRWEAQEFADLAYFEPHYIAPPNITTAKKRPPVRRI